MKKHRVEVSILNTNYAILTEENDEYIKTIAKEVEQNIEQVMLNNENISSMSAVILTSMDYCDKIKKSADGVNELYKQTQEYKKMAESYREALEKANKEIESLKRNNRHNGR